MTNLKLLDKHLKVAFASGTATWMIVFSSVERSYRDREGCTL